MATGERDCLDDSGTSFALGRAAHRNYPFIRRDAEEADDRFRQNLLQLRAVFVAAVQVVDAAFRDPEIDFSRSAILGHFVVCRAKRLGREAMFYRPEPQMMRSVLVANFIHHPLAIRRNTVIDQRNPGQHLLRLSRWQIGDPDFAAAIDIRWAAGHKIEQLAAVMRQASGSGVAFRRNLAISLRFVDPNRALFGADRGDEGAAVRRHRNPFLFRRFDW